jgi:DNA-binding response OmpR family regulator
MGDKKNLVIEDDADVRLGYQVVLKANNYATCFAADAMCAISEARKQQPDLIILDLGLPAGDGFIVLERLRANTQISHDPRHRGVRPPPFRTQRARFKAR